MLSWEATPVYPGQNGVRKGGGAHNSAGGDMRTQCLYYHGYNLGRVQNVTPLLYIKLNYIWFKDSPMIGFWVHPSHKKITNFLT